MLLSVKPAAPTVSDPDALPDDPLLLVPPPPELLPLHAAKVPARASTEMTVEIRRGMTRSPSVSRAGWRRACRASLWSSLGSRPPQDGRAGKSRFGHVHAAG